MVNDYQLIEKFVKAKKCGESVALATVISTHRSTPRKVGAKMLVYGDGKTVGTIGGGILEAEVIKEARKALSVEKPLKIAYSLDPKNPKSLTMCCGGEIELFIDII